MGAVAACIRRDSSTSSGDSTSSFPPLDGQAFCFLPLPVRTQMPLHVNAYFELSSNRRDIWRGDDTTGESRIRGQWNQLLLRDVLAPLYGLLLSRAVLYSTRQQTLQTPLESPLEMSDALLFTGAGAGGERAIEQYMAAVARRRKLGWTPLGLLPCPAPPEPWSALSSALLPLLRTSEVVMKITSL